MGGGARPFQRPMLAPLSKAAGEAPVAFVSESGDVGVDETFHGKFGERVEDLVVRLGLLLLPPARLPRATRTLTRTLTLTLTDTLTLIHPTSTPTPTLTRCGLSRWCSSSRAARRPCSSSRRRRRAHACPKRAAASAAPLYYPPHPPTLSLPSRPASCAACGCAPRVVLSAV